MQTSRSKTKPHYTFTDSSIPVMLRSTKALLSHKKNVIFRCIEPVIRK